MRALWSRLGWRLWRRHHARRKRVHTRGPTFEGLVWYRDRYELHLLDAHVWDEREVLQPVGGEMGHAQIPLANLVWMEAT